MGSGCKREHAYNGKQWIKKIIVSCAANHAVNTQLEGERGINHQSTPFSHSCSSCKVIYIAFGLESGLHVSILVVQLNDYVNDVSSES